MELGVKGNNTNTVTLSKFHRNSIGFIYRRRPVCKKLIEFRSRGPIRGLINTEERKESGWRTRGGENDPLKGEKLSRKNGKRGIFLEIVPGEIRRPVSRVYATLLTSGILATPSSYDRKIGWYAFTLRNPRDKSSLTGSVFTIRNKRMKRRGRNKGGIVV